MGSGNDLRVAHANLYEVVHDNCTQLRASEIVRQQAEARQRGEVGGQSFDEIAKGHPADAVSLAKTAEFQDQYPSGVDIVIVRARIREELRQLRSTLLGELTSTEVYEALFPVTIHCDELIRTAAGSQAYRWEALQSEMFDIEDGGYQFFSRLQALLDSEAQEHPFVLEAYYYCLNDGFGGRWRGNERRLDELRAILRGRISPAQPDAAKQKAITSVEVKDARFPWQLLVGLGVALVAIFLVLRLYAWVEIGGAG